MERRLNIYEKIKTSKLNKLTIKQGDVNVKLNLKKDLIDPNVEINDKVLDMLEIYADKNLKQQQQQQQEQQQKEQESQPVQTHIDTDQCSIDTELSISSPSKRVRFTIDSSDQQNLIPISLPIEQQISQDPIDESQQESNSQTQTNTEDNLKKDYLCRLCKLKCSNERALHEHVTRIHGGKGASNQNFISKLKNNNLSSIDTPDDEYETSSDLDDLDSQDETYLSSSSDISSKKSIFSKKILKPQPPRPNVAIRVAKVAYYNSKGTINSNNPFKSNIFKNGGLRGNFFSQERLPLRSCKIKMKLTSNLNESNNDEFLINTHQILKNDYIDTNKTISYQTSTLKSSHNDSNDLILNENEIKIFFKSLLDYIPINSVTRLDDLIKSNEDYLSNEQKLVDENVDLIKYLKLTYETILNSKQIGISLYELKSYLNNKNGMIKMNMIKKILNFLLENHLILSVGVVERVYVAHEFKQHWVIESYKNQRGRGYHNEDNESIIDQDEDLNELDDKNDKKRYSKKSDCNSSYNEDMLNSKNFKPVCLIPRPWRYIDGLLNRPVLKKMLESIILYLKTYPNSSFNTISSHFCPVLQPIMTLELLEMLEKLKCIKKIILKKENDCDLFSDFNNGSFRVYDENDLDGNELFTYYLNQSSIFNIKKIFPN